MTPEQKQTHLQLIQLYHAIRAVQDVAIGLKALHWETLTPEQKSMVEQAVIFSFADTMPIDHCTSGDALYWDLHKFMPLKKDL